MVPSVEYTGCSHPVQVFYSFPSPISVGIVTDLVRKKIGILTCKGTPSQRCSQWLRGCQVTSTAACQEAVEFSYLLLYRVSGLYKSRHWKLWRGPVLRDLISELKGKVWNFRRHFSFFIDHFGSGSLTISHQLSWKTNRYTSNVGISLSTEEKRLQKSTTKGSHTAHYFPHLSLQRRSHGLHLGRSQTLFACMTLQSESTSCFEKAFKSRRRLDNDIG